MNFEVAWGWAAYGSMWLTKLSPASRDEASDYIKVWVENGLAADRTLGDHVSYGQWLNAQFGKRN